MMLVWSTSDGFPRVLEFDASLTEQHSMMADVTRHPVEEGAAVSDHIRANPAEIEITGLITNSPLYSTSRAADAEDTTGGAGVIASVSVIQRNVNLAPVQVPDVLDASVRSFGQQNLTARKLAKPAEIKTAASGALQTALNALGLPNQIGLGVTNLKFPAPSFSVIPAVWTAVPISVAMQVSAMRTPTDRVQEAFEALQELAQSGYLVTVHTKNKVYSDMALSKLSIPVAPVDALEFSMSFVSVRTATSVWAGVKISKKVPRDKRAQSTLPSTLAPFTTPDIDQGSDIVLNVLGD